MHACPDPPANEPAPVNRYVNVGRARTPAKSDAARANGKRGGRPRKWSREVCAMVAGWIRERLEADAVVFYNEKQELRHLVKALEAGKVR